MKEKFGFAIDRGGTFTDVYVRRPDGSSRVLKLLSEDPQNYKDAPTEAIRRVIQEEIGKELPRGEPIPTEQPVGRRMPVTGMVAVWKPPQHSCYQFPDPRRDEHLGWVRGRPQRELNPRPRDW
uniref:Hydantoinase/oxoprolinase N-terminal domain-containing protein n=1 Tax=Plectus sambesii TaxID=2011161 RepID=A0A914WUW0_9BILA